MSKIVVILKVDSVTATDTTKIQVNFSGAVDRTKVTATLKQGLATQYTTLAFADDNKSVTLTAPTAIAAGDHNVVVSGLAIADVVTPLTIVAATPTAVEVTNTQATIGVNSLILFSVTNQYGTDMGVLGNDTSLSISAYDVTTGNVVALDGNSATKSEFTLKLSDADTTKIKLGDDIRIIVCYKGLTVTKTIKIVATSTVSDVSLGNVLPLASKTLITAGETGLVLPYTLKNQYGTDVKLVAGSAGSIGSNNPAITFLSSNKAVVDPADFIIDENGQLTIKALGAGTAKITAIINATGKVATTNVTVSSIQALKTVVIASPQALLSKDQTALLNLTGIDQYGVTTTDFSAINVQAKTTNNDITGTVSNGVLIINAANAGSATLTLVDKVDNTIVYGTISVKFEAAAVATTIVGIDTPNTE